ncbi:serine protease [Burkholderia sp. Tr-20390]|uniref:S1 family peptidase n=1 Tax=Burkholderia sp. Tr-20390 TaxID=2703904 RepID=UPI00197D4425|nr:serine protease [Burkholderia sp. Tr-20390]MBN3729407.1 trypsin-like peptidase domain-containing protein [Burkholderia sp. Tr-20390]
MSKESRRANRQRRGSENGIAQSPRFAATLNGVVPVDPNGAILPIIREIDGGRSGQIIGTGFFVAHGLVITAGHVVDVSVADSSNKSEQLLDAPLWCVQIIPGTNEYHWRPIVRAQRHTRSDIALCRLRPAVNEHGGPLGNPILRLSDHDPEIGTPVATYAHPDSRVRRRGTRVQMELRPHYYEGRIDDHFPNGRDSCVITWPCFQTSIHIHGGASGGPVFDAVTGTVFGVCATSFEPYTDTSYVTKIHDAMGMPVSVGQTAGTLGSLTTTLGELNNQAAVIGSVLRPFGAVYK